MPPLRLERQWMGMDIWDGAHDIALQRLADPDLQVRYTTAPPVRTDEGDLAAPAFKWRRY